jgi:zinc-ribbon domain
MRCTTCGAALRPDDRFCTQCATPVPAPGGGRAVPMALAVVLAVALLAAAGGGTWYLLQGRTAVAVPAAPSAGPGADGSPNATALPRPVQPPAPPRPTTADPAAALAAQADADRPAAEASLGFWLPQVSSKFSGLEVDGVVYDEARILAEFRLAQQRYGAVLVRSEDYTSFQRPGVWVVLVPQRDNDPDTANAWCDSQGFAPGDCFAKRLSHTEGPSGNTRHRS